MPVPEPELPILDEATLSEVRESVEGDTAFVGELITAYLADGTAHLAAIEAAVAAGDAAALVRPAHTLKSSSATVGAMRLSARARRLEEAGRSGSIDDEATRTDAGALAADWQATSEALRAWASEAGR